MPSTAGLKRIPRICVNLNCPHPYLALESIAGPKEVWFFNGYTSNREVQEVDDAYGRNPVLLAALNEIVRRKAGLLGSDSTNIFTSYRPDLSGGERGRWAKGAFL
jgi:hypothetical protein